MKIITTCSNLAHKAELGAVLALSKILLSPGALSLLEGFWKLYTISSTSIWLLLHLTKLSSSPRSSKVSTTPSSSSPRFGS